MKNLITCLVVCVLSSAAIADTWTVDDDGKADFDNIQAAVDASSDGDEIIVMPGWYTSTQSDQVVDMLGKAVTLRSNDPSDPDVVALTIIFGEDSRRGIVCISGETKDTIIDGLTIAWGFSSGEGDDAYGGGMFCKNSSPTINNCMFSFNTSVWGGGMCNYQSSPTLTNCNFANNYSTEDGSGMLNYESSPILWDCNFVNNSGGGMYNTASSPTLFGCNFTNNFAFDNGGCQAGYSPDCMGTCFEDSVYTDWIGDGICDDGQYIPADYGYGGPAGVPIYLNCDEFNCDGGDCPNCDAGGEPASVIGSDNGGGMFNNYNSSPTLTNCIFTNNAANVGGGMYNSGSSPILLNCEFVGNTANDDGGGLANSGGGSPTLTNCTFQDNVANSLGGGTLFLGGSDPTLTNCTFTNNSILDNGGPGGAVGIGYDSIGSFNNCVFSQSSAGWGGAIFIYEESDPSFTGCVFSDNNAATHYGGAIYAASNSNPNLDECDFSDNHANISGGAVLWNSDGSINNCTFSGNTAAGGGAVSSISLSGSNPLEWNLLPKLIGCEFTGNTANSRGGACLVQGNAYLRDCTFTNNETLYYFDDPECYEGGGAVFIAFEETVTFENCIASNNTVPNGGGEGIQVWFNSTIEFIGDNSFDGIAYGSCDLNGLSLHMGAESIVELSNDLTMPPNGVTSFDINDIATTPSLVVEGELVRDGCLSITNESHSLMGAQAGDTIQLMQAESWSLWFSSLVFPLLPEGLGMEFLGDGITVWAKIVEIEPAAFDDPLTADLNEPPIKIIVFDPDGDGIDEIVMLFGGDVDKVVAYSVSEDNPPEPIEGLYADVLDGSVDFSAADLDGDGLDDLLIVNSQNNLITICKTSNTGGSLVFDVSTINVPGSATDTITCVSAIDWDGDSDLDAVVGVDVADQDNQVNTDGYRVLLDVASDAPIAGPWFEIALFDIDPQPSVQFEGDPPTSVAPGNDGFVGGTRYGRVHQGSSGSNELDVLGELGGKNVFTLKTKDLNDDGGDGLLDIMLTSNEAESIYLLEGDSDEPDGYGELIPLLVSDPIEDITAFDADGDGDTDLFYTSPQSDPPLPLIVLRNDSPLGFRAQTLTGITWSKQTAGSSAISLVRITSGGLSPKDDEDDWVTGAGNQSSNIRGEPGVVMEQINIRLLASCPSDFNGDDIVDVNDLLILIADWGTCTDNCNSDVNDDGEVDVNDLLILIAAWGACP